MNLLDQILQDLQLLARVGQLFPGIGIPGIGIPADAAAKLLAIAQVTVKAHEALTGQPLDLNLLKPVDPVQ